MAVVAAVISCLVAQLINRVLQVALAVVALTARVLEVLQLLVKEMQVVLVTLVLVLLVAVAVRVRLVAVPLALPVRLEAQVLHLASLALLLPTQAAEAEALTAMLVVLVVQAVEVLEPVQLFHMQLTVQQTPEAVVVEQGHLETRHVLVTAALVL